MPNTPRPRQNRRGESPLGPLEKRSELLDRHHGETIAMQKKILGATIVIGVATGVYALAAIAMVLVSIFQHYNPPSESPRDATPVVINCNCTSMSQAD